jgi:hypothetical protein
MLPTRCALLTLATFSSALFLATPGKAQGW